MENRCLDFLYEVFGGGSLDWNKLFNEMDDFELESSETMQEIRNAYEVSEVDFNVLMYVTLYLGAEKMKNVLIDYAKDNCDNSDEIEKAIRNYEVKIFCNYLDSFIDDDIFGWCSYQDLENKEKQKEMLEALLEKVGVECDCKSD